MVRCVANTGASIQEANIAPEMGIDRSTEFPVTIDREYVVFAVTMFRGTAWYYVLDDDRRRWPIWKPASLFEVIDGSLPDSWIFGYFRFTHDDQYPILSFPEWAGDHSFYERLVDDEREAAEIFVRRRAEIERCQG